MTDSININISGISTLLPRSLRLRPRRHDAMKGAEVEPGHRVATLQGSSFYSVEPRRGFPKRMYPLQGVTVSYIRNYTLQGCTVDSSYSTQ